MHGTSVFTEIMKRFNGVIAPSFMPDLKKKYIFSGNCIYTDLIIPLDRGELFDLEDSDVEFLDENDEFIFDIVAVK